MTLLNTKNVLLVEDNEINQLIAEAMLESIGINVTVAANGQQALDEVKEKNYDLVPMDIQMPVMDGITVCRKIRETNQSLPIIALTANVMLDDILTYQVEGFNGYIAKPTDLDVLMQVLVQNLLD
ncbi:MAG: CheY-like chemotaxis protein [Colwellia sp.]